MRSINGGSAAWSSIVAVLEGMAGQDVTAWSDTQVRDGVLALLRAHHQLTALVSAAVDSFDTRDLADPDGFKATRSWLCAYGRMSQGAATGWLRRGRLQRDLPELGAAARAGDASAEQLRLVDDLCRKVGTDPVRPCDSTLAEVAAHATPAEVGAVCDRIRAWIDPDGPEPDPTAHHRRELTLSRQGSLVQLRGQLDLEGAAAIHTALDAWMTPPHPDDPRSAAHRRADALIELARHTLTHADTPTVGGARPQLGLLLTPDTLRNLHPTPPPAGIAPWATPPDEGASPTPTATSTGAGTSTSTGAGTGIVTGTGSVTCTGAGTCAGTGIVTGTGAGAGIGMGSGAGIGAGAGTGTVTGTGIVMGTGNGPPLGHPGTADPLAAPLADPLAGLLAGPEPPWLNWVGTIPTTTAQRIACDSDIWRIILDPATGLPLDVGRTHRLVPHWIRKALHARDRGCRWPGCTAAASWTDAHHLIPWYYDGDTNIDNLLSLCRHHHMRVHEDHWTAHLNPTTGQVWVTRPDGTPYDLGPSHPWRPAPDTGTRAPARVPDTGTGDRDLTRAPARVPDTGT